MSILTLEVPTLRVVKFHYKKSEKKNIEEIPNIHKFH